MVVPHEGLLYLALCILGRAKPTPETDVALRTEDPTQIKRVEENHAFRGILNAPLLHTIRALSRASTVRWTYTDSVLSRHSLDKNSMQGRR